jgi:hypothetical protein
LWVQLSGDHQTLPALRLFYEASAELVAPFRGTETTTPVNPDGILELATVVAILAYIILTLLVAAALLLLEAVGRAISSLVATRAGHAGVPSSSHQPA